jgi:hypothetical protein
MTTLKDELASQHEEIVSYLAAFGIIGIILIDSALNILDCNQGFIKMFQLQNKPLGTPIADFLILGDKDLKHTREMKISCSHQSAVNGLLYCRAFEAKNGFLLFCERLILTESRAIEQIGMINNELINLQRELVKKNVALGKLRLELDDRVEELEATLARVKQLEGIIPICAYCKKIRDDQDDWHRLENYITDHSEAQFSHGICPTCFEKEMKEIKS